MSDLVTGLLPVLDRSLGLGFNVFDVMHHGTHEKQISNVFRWMLDESETHMFGDRFVRVFIDQLNQAVAEREPFPLDSYWVRQEVNTSTPGDDADIADLVLESDAAAIVIENYFTSDPHGHDYGRFKAFSERDGRQGVVVLLCRDEDRSLQTEGWQHAPVLRYRALVDRLLTELDADPKYRLQNSDAYAFIEQMHRKYVRGGGRMEDEDVLDFVVTMCAIAEARRYQVKDTEAAAEQFASDLAEQARARFGEGRQLLQRAKGRLRNYGRTVLMPELNKTLGPEFVRNVSARWAGIYQWSVNFDIAEENDFDAGLSLKFGPSAWYANQLEKGWAIRVDPSDADYSHLFLTAGRQHVIRQ